MKFKVTAGIYNTESRGIVKHNNGSTFRDEIIDTSDNDLFSDCETIRDVEYRYADYWNFLNHLFGTGGDGYDERNHRPTEKVFVVNVVKL